VTEAVPTHGSATAIAREIRRRVKGETGLTVSVGAGPNKLVAKIASDHGKPDGLVVVPPPRVLRFLAPLPVRALHGVGPSTERSLEALGVHTVAELRRLSLESLLARFHSHGRTLFEYARGIDPRPVRVEQERKSLGSERTFARDLADLREMDGVLATLADEVAAGLARRDLAACTVTVKVRLADFTTLTRSHTVRVATAEAAALLAHACELLRRTPAGTRAVRLLGVTASTLVPARWRQLELFTPAGPGE